MLTWTRRQREQGSTLWEKFKNSLHGHCDATETFAEVTPSEVKINSRDGRWLTVRFTPEEKYEVHYEFEDGTCKYAQILAKEDQAVFRRETVNSGPGQFAEKLVREFRAKRL
jgi:hypothetical protein